jgi:hypothetical protein
MPNHNAREQVHYHGADARRIYVSILAAVILPAAQAALTGGLVGVSVGSLVGGLAMIGEVKQPALLGALCGLVSGCLVATVAWFRFRGEWRETVLMVEEALGMDLDGDGRAGRIEPATKIEWAEGSSLRYDELPCSDEQLTQVARKVLSGVSLSQGNLSPIFGGSRAAVQEFQARLVERGYCRYRNSRAPAQGIEPTAKGMAMFRARAGYSPTPAEDE